MSANNGSGAASQVLTGKRSAMDVRTLNGLPYGQFKMPVTLDIDLSAYGIGL